MRRIRHLISWLPIIWRDRDWDWIYLIIILNRKLSNMERFFASSDTHLENSDKVRDQIEHARVLTDLILADEYFVNAFRSHEEKWGKPVYGSIPSEDGLTSEWTVDYPNVKTEQDKIDEHCEGRAKILRSVVAKEQDIDELFAIMARRLQGWWD